MNTTAVKKELYESILKPLFEDIGSGFSLRRPRGLDRIKTKEDQQTFKKEYISVDESTLEKYINVRLDQETRKQKQLSKKGESLSKQIAVKDADVNIQGTKNLPTVFRKPELQEIPVEIKQDVMAEVVDLLKQIRDNTKPLSFKDQVLAKKENDQDDKAMRDLIEALKIKDESVQSTVINNGGSSDNGFLPDSSDYDRNDKGKNNRRPNGGRGKARWFSKAKDLAGTATGFAMKPKGMGMIGAGVATASEGYDYYTGEKEATTKNVSKSIGRVIGTGFGTAIGGIVGGSLGTLASPGVGTAIGGVSGGIAGGTYGGDFGDWLGGKIGDLLEDGSGAKATSSAEVDRKFKGSSEDVQKAIIMASKKAGVDEGMMKQIAHAESGFNPNAGAGTSSAKGLYQFIDSTWDNMLAKHAKKYNIPRNASRYDPYANALMGAEFIKENQNELSDVKAKKDINATDIYAAHFLGASGGKKLLKNMQTNPKGVAADYFPAEAESNLSVFYKDPKNRRGARTLTELYAELGKRVGTPKQTQATKKDDKIPVKDVEVKKPVDKPKIQQELQKSDQQKLKVKEDEDRRRETVLKENTEALRKLADKKEAPRVPIKAPPAGTPRGADSRSGLNKQRLVLDRIQDKSLIYLSNEE